MGTSPAFVETRELISDVFWCSISVYVHYFEESLSQQIYWLGNCWIKAIIHWRVFFTVTWVWWWCNASEEQPSVIAIADKSKLRSKNHNELAVLKQPLNVMPIICGHLVVTILCPSNYVWFSYGMPNGTSEGNQYLGSSSRSVGDILFSQFLQHVGSWPFYIMTLTLPKRQPAGTDSGHCPSGKWQYAHVHTNREGGAHTHWHMYWKSGTHVQTKANVQMHT